MRSILYLCIVVVIASCTVYESSEEDLVLDIVLDDKKISQHEDIQGEFRVTNVSGSKIEYKFNNGCQFRLKLEFNNETIYDTRYVYGCIMAITYLELQNNEQKSYNIRIPNKESFSKGTYILSASLTNDHSGWVSTKVIVE